MTTTGKAIVGEISQRNAYSLKEFVKEEAGVIAKKEMGGEAIDVASSDAAILTMKPMGIVQGEFRPLEADYAARLYGETKIAQSVAPAASGEAKFAQPDVYTIGVTRLMDGPYEWKIGASQPITEEGFKRFLDREAASDFPPKAVLFKKKSVAIKFADKVKLGLSERNILEMLKERFNETDFLLPHLTGSEIWRISDGSYKWKIRATGSITEEGVRRFIDYEEISGFPPNVSKEAMFKDKIVEIEFIDDVKFEIDKSKAIEIFKARFKEATFKIVEPDAPTRSRQTEGGSSSKGGEFTLKVRGGLGWEGRSENAGATIPIDVQPTFRFGDRGVFSVAPEVGASYSLLTGPRASALRAFAGLNVGFGKRGGWSVALGGGYARHDLAGDARSAYYIAPELRYCLSPSSNESGYELEGFVTPRAFTFSNGDLTILTYLGISVGF